MPGLPRKSSLTQFKKLRSKIKKQGGDIGDKCNLKAEMKLPNSLWVDNPVDRDADVINNHVKLEIESFTNYLKESRPGTRKITEDDIFEVKMYSCVCPACDCDANLCDDKHGFEGMSCDCCGCIFEF